MALSVACFGMELVTDSIYRGRDKPKWLEQHDAAALASAGVFLDNAVYFSFAVSFAGIIFNYRSAPLLYEDKLGQTATLLAVDAPVAILLLTYPRLDRGKLRSVLVFLAVLMVFIIQFLFRKAKSFNPGTSLCFDWDEFVQNVFRQRFIAKTVWFCLVLFFCIFLACPWGIFRRAPEDTRTPWVNPAWWQRTKSSVVYSKGRLFAPLHDEPTTDKELRTVAAYAEIVWVKVPWRRVIALLLAAYAMFDSYIDIRFLW